MIDAEEAARLRSITAHLLLAEFEAGARPTQLAHPNDILIMKGKKILARLSEIENLLTSKSTPSIDVLPLSSERQRLKNEAVSVLSGLVR